MDRSDVGTLPGGSGGHTGPSVQGPPPPARHVPRGAGAGARSEVPPQSHHGGGQAGRRDQSPAGDGVGLPRSAQEKENRAPEPLQVVPGVQTRPKVISDQRTVPNHLLHRLNI